MADKIIAVDFDGTLCENAWPDIGEPIQLVIDYVLDEQKRGAKLILWTNRHNSKLEEAVAWCEDHHLVFDAVNGNLPEIIEAFGGDTRKVFANEYIDDRGITPNDITLGDVVQQIKNTPITIKREPIPLSSYICLFLATICFGLIGSIRSVLYAIEGGVFNNLVLGIVYLLLCALCVVVLSKERKKVSY